MIFNNKLYRIFSIVTILVLMMSTSTVANHPPAFAGYISDNRVNEGDTVVFSGSISNNLTEDIFVQQFNISFVERIGQDTTRQPDKLNFTKGYPENKRAIAVNTTFTETLSEEINFEPGSYDVSIFFAYSNDSVPNAADAIQNVYTLANQTFIVEGLTSSSEIARNIGFIIAGIVLVTILILGYSKFSKS